MSKNMMVELYVSYKKGEVYLTEEGIKHLEKELNISK